MSTALLRSFLSSLVRLVMVAVMLLLAGAAAVSPQPVATGASDPESTGTTHDDLPEPPDLVLRLPDGREVPGELGTYAWGDDESFVIVDAIGVVVPPEPVDVAAGALVWLDASALGTPTEIAYTLYRVRRGSLEQVTKTAKVVTAEACRLAHGEWPTTLVVPLVLNLSPGRYALAVTARFDGAREVNDGFYLRVTRPSVGTPRAAVATSPAVGGTPGADLFVLEATSASPCAATSE